MPQDPQETLLLMDRLLNGITLPVLTSAAQLLGWAAELGGRAFEKMADQATLALAVGRSDVTWVDAPEEAEKICALLREKGVRAPMLVRLEGRTCILTPGDQRALVAEILLGYYGRQETAGREEDRQDGGQDTGTSRVVPLDRLRRYGEDDLRKVTVSDRDGDCTGVILSQRLSRAGIPHCVRSTDPEHVTLVFAARDERKVRKLRDATLLDQVTDMGALLRRVTRLRCQVRQEAETSLWCGALPDRAGGGRIRSLVLGLRSGTVLEVRGHTMTVSDPKGRVTTLREGTRAWEETVRQVLGSCDCVVQLTPEDRERFLRGTPAEREALLLQREGEEHTFADLGRQEPDEEERKGLRRRRAQVQLLVRLLADRGVDVSAAPPVPERALAFELGLTPKEYIEILDQGLPEEIQAFPREVLDRLEQELGEPECYDPTLDLDLERLWREMDREKEGEAPEEEPGRGHAKPRDEREV